MMWKRIAFYTYDYVKLSRFAGGQGRNSESVGILPVGEEDRNQLV